MKFEPIAIDWKRLAGGEWRGPLLAALITLVAALPGLVLLPPLDRDESRFAQATSQMLETRDFVTINYQDQPRYKKPVGIHWLQAAAVTMAGQVEERRIWAYRLPSLLGAMLAAAACAWGVAAFYGARAGLFAGALLGSSLLLSTEAGIAKTDAVLCGCTTLSMAALGRLYAAAREGPPAGWRSRLLLWLGLGVGILVKGPIAPMVVLLAMAALALTDRPAGWLKRIGWGWGGVLICAIVLPWAFAITVATDGAFWSAAIGGDLAPKLAAGGQEGHAAAPGYHTLLAPILFFPGTLLLPAAAVLAWQGRRQPGVRFALCWFIPAFLVFELSPTKLVHYPLPTYGALAWLAAAALAAVPGPRARRIGAIALGFIGVLLGAVVVYLCHEYGRGVPAWLFAILAALAFLASGLAGGWLMLREQAGRAVIVAITLSILGHGLLVAGLGPRLDPLWVSVRVSKALSAAGLNPRDGVAPGPVAVAGYAEPSLVFALGAQTQLVDGKDAADAVQDGRPAVVEAAQQGAFQAELARLGLDPVSVGEVDGLDYSDGDTVRVRLYPGVPAASPPSPVR